MAAKRKRPAKKKAAKKKAAAKAPDNVTSITKAKRKLPPQLEANKWKPGQSGNPKGRPKQKTLEESLRTFLQGVLEVDLETGDEVTRLDAMVRIIFSEGVTQRNSKILVAIMDRLWPKPIVLKTDLGEPIQVAVRPDLSHLTVKELEQISKLRKRVAAGASE